MPLNPYLNTQNRSDFDPSTTHNNAIACRHTYIMIQVEQI